MSLVERLAEDLNTPLGTPEIRIEGRVTRMIGLTLEAVGLRVALGDYCRVQISKHQVADAEVVGFAGDRIYLMPLATIDGLEPGARVWPSKESSAVPVGEGLLGRVIDGIGRPLDSNGELKVERWVELEGSTINPLQRAPIKETLDVGVRAINGLLAVGRGQRMGLFAGSGVGKSVLLGMMTRFTEAEVIVVGLIGERGREVREFIEQSLGEAGLARSVVVAAPADESPLMRLRASQLATRIAEDFRDQGKNVLLLMDSLTRFAQAQREIALAIGEPPATKGYPPSVFAKLPKLVERAGNGRSDGGSITAFYTVLTEGDDQQDPVADAARAILDGHIVLSRDLAEQGHYPAIDLEASISRAMPQILAPDRLDMALQLRRLWSRYEQNADLISVGAYAPGSDADIDLAIKMREAIVTYLQQGMQDPKPMQSSVQELAMLVDGARQLKAQAEAQAKQQVQRPQIPQGRPAE